MSQRVEEDAPSTLIALCSRDAIQGKFFSHSRNAGPRSSRFSANSTVAFRNPSLSPASCRLPS